MPWSRTAEGRPGGPFKIRRPKGREGCPEVAVRENTELTGTQGHRRRRQQRNAQGGGKKPQEAQKAKAHPKMKAAKDAGEEHYDPTHEDNILVRNETRLALWEEHLKDPIVALDKALKCVEKSVLEFLGPSTL